MTVGEQDPLVVDVARNLEHRLTAWERPRRVPVLRGELVDLRRWGVSSPTRANARAFDPLTQTARTRDTQNAGGTDLPDVAGCNRVAPAVDRQIARVAQQHLHRAVHLL